MTLRQHVSRMAERAWQLPPLLPMEQPQLRDPHECYREVFENARESVFITDPAGIVTAANPAAMTLALPVTDRPVGQPLPLLFAPAADGRLLREQLAGEFDELELCVQRNGGPELWLLLHVASHRDRSGRVRGYHAIGHDITERRRLEERLTHDAMHDPLTGLPNRALFMDRLRQALARIRREPTCSCAVLFLDLDHFKRVNDSYGHAAGDALLRNIATTLFRCMRQEDTVARIGGDEFAILLEDSDGTLDARAAADRIVQSLQQPLDVGGFPLSVSLSIGIAYPGAGEESPDAVLSNADVAMYRAKLEGPARFTVCSTAAPSPALPESAML
jgi:diguanylate cyclase (GGDEF)-like protein/PAS domain S-box-containing protein